MEQLLILLAGVLVGWLTTLSGVALGGFLVFRTKRESYDPLFKPMEQQGQAFNIPFEGEDDETVQEQPLPENVMNMNSRFAQQFEERILRDAQNTSAT